MMNKKTVAQIIIEVLQEAGVRNCYGIVGDTLNYVTDAISKSGIEWVHVRHEEVGAFAAGAEAYISGRLTACAGSCGPGSLHFINGIFEAQRNGAPVVLIASQITAVQHYTEFPQYVDFKAVYSKCSVFCEEVNSPEDARRMAVLAVQSAINKKGVAILILPAEISKMEIVDNQLMRVYTPEPVIFPNQDELEQIAFTLNQGKRVGIYAGQGSHLAHDELVKLAQLLKAPIAHTSRAKDFVEYDNPYNVGMTGIFGMESGFHMMKTCDTLLILGADFAWSQFYPDKAKIIQIDIDSTHLGRRHPITMGFVGSIKPTLEALLPLIVERMDREFLDECVTLHEHAIKKLDKKAVAAKNSMIHPQYLTELLSQYADDDALFTADGGSPMVWLCRHIQVNGQRRTLASLKHGTMSNAMPQAIGLQKAYPDRQVISLSGDGGFAMLMGDILTLVQEKLPVKIVIFNNRSLNFVELEQKVEGLLNNFTDLQNPDFASLAEVAGFYGRKVTDAEMLEDAVKEFLSRSGPAILDVKISHNELVMPPHIEMGQVMGMALYGAKAMIAGRAKEVATLLTDNFIKK